jgi:hypothetical protein
VSENAIRKRIRRGQLQTRRVNHAKSIHMVLPDVPPRGRQNGPRRPFG